MLIPKLSPPVLPQMNDDGIISEDELDEGRIDIVFDRYDNAESGDTIRVFFNEDPIGYKLITNANDDFPVFIYQEASGLFDGTYPVYAKVIDQASNENVSEVIYAVLKRDRNEDLPAPIFLDAENGYLPANKIISQGGTRVEVPLYSNKGANDLITVSFYIKDSFGNLVPGSQFSLNHSVIAGEAEYFINIPLKFILLVDKGTAYVSYNVKYAGNGNLSQSKMASVNLFSEYVNAGKCLGGSTGFMSTRTSVLQDCFVEFLATDKNRPLIGVDVTFSIDGGNTFQANSEKVITVRTDQDGYAKAHVSGVDQSANYISAKCLANEINQQISFKVNRTDFDTYPYIIYKPEITDSNENSLVLKALGNVGVFNVSSDDNVIFIMDGIEYDMLKEISISSSSPVEFKVRRNADSSIKLRLTDVNNSTLICQFIF